MTLFDAVTHPVKTHAKDFRFFCMDAVSVTFAGTLLVNKVDLVGCQGWLSSMEAVQIGQTRLPAIYMPTVLASMSDYIMYFIELNMLWSGALVMRF